MASMLLIIKDLRGFRLANTNLSDGRGFNGVSFKLDDGRDVSHNVYPATVQNVRAIATGDKMAGLGPNAVVDNPLFFWPMKAKQAVEVLDTFGFGVDDELRVKAKLGEPFTLIKPGHIGPMIAIHEQMCKEMTEKFEEAKNKAGGKLGPGETQAVWGRAVDSEKEPVQIIAGPEGKLGQVYQPDKIVGIPEMPEDLGKFGVYRGQITLSWHEHHLIPKGPNVFTMFKYLPDVQYEFDTLEELFKSGKFLTKDGVICKDGASKLEINTISIDDFLK